MIRIYLSLLIILINQTLNANESNETEIIELHNNKSLDELVVEKLNQDETNLEVIEEDLNVIDEDENPNETVNNEIENGNIIENNLEYDTFFGII